MAKLTRYIAPTTSQLLHHIFDRPELVAAVRDLAPVALGQLIEHVGLEDAGELVALASLPQLERIFDDDLWRAERPGGAEHFDPQRFALWLAAMLEAGEAVVAKRLVELPRDLVTLAVHRLVLVLDIEALAMQASEGEDELEPIEKALEDSLSDEWDEFRLIARDPRCWDTVLAALLALDRDYSEELREILERCAAMSTRYIEEHGGLYEVLTAEQSLEEDVAGERQDRRAAAGFVSPTDAQAFLAGIAVATSEDLAADARDPVTHAYFRELGPEPEGALPAKPARKPHSKPPHGVQALRAEREQQATRAAHHELMQLLQDAKILPKSAPPARRRLSGRAAAEGAADTNAPDAPEAIARQLRSMLPLERALLALASTDTGALLASQRREELAFLANTLVSGASVGGRRMRPIEALEAAVAATNLGLELSLAPAADPDWVAVLQHKGADRLFRVGYRALRDEVVLPARAALRALVARNSEGEPDPDAQRHLERAIDLGSIDLLNEELSAFELGIDEAVWTALLGLVQPCPALAGRMLDGQSKAQAHGTFIAHRTQLEHVRRFLIELGVA